MSNIQNIHTRLKIGRIAAGYKTATEFCEKNHIPISTYNMHETGKRRLMPDIAEKYSEIMKINTAWLLTGTGSPYPDQIGQEDTSNLTEDEYLKLLNYKGNHKIPLQPINNEVVLKEIDPKLFCKIIIDIISALKEYSMMLELNFVTNHAIEIYKDIILTSDSHKDQLTMVDLAITIFKRKLQEISQDK